jgi:ABC-type branched-subunit amino acid transport system ATPase component
MKSSASMEILTAQGVDKSFGGVKAVDDLSMTVRKDEILGLIGPNGAGKTTVFNLITGVHPADSGFITFNDRRIDGLKPHSIARLGISRTYQNIRLFESLTVYEHVRFGQNIRARGGPREGKSQSDRPADLHAEAGQILNFLGLWEVRERYAASLPYGQQRRVEIARALATHPLMLLLDEPTAGMTLDEKREILQVIDRIRRSGVAIMVIEHDMRVIMNICDRIIVLNFGQKIAEGTPLEIHRDLKAKEVYLGRG